MRFAKAILAVVIAVAFSAYAFDCLAMSTPEEAMQCCNSMPCSPHSAGHSEDCCKTMSALHASFVQPHGARGASQVPVVVTVLPVIDVSQGVDSAMAVLAAQSHATPFPDAVAASPLRI